MNFRNSVFLLALVIAFCLGSANPTIAGENITVKVNNQVIQADVPATIVNDSTMLPFRAILNAIGIADDHIKWHASSQSVEIFFDKKYILLVIGSNGAVFNENMITLNAAPFISNNRTMIPVRFVAEAFGAQVQWHANTHTVNIKTQ